MRNVIVVAVLWKIEDKWRLNVWSAVLSLLPALLLVFLTKRVEIFLRMKRDVSKVAYWTPADGVQVRCLGSSGSPADTYFDATFLSSYLIG